MTSTTASVAPKPTFAEVTEKLQAFLKETSAPGERESFPLLLPVKDIFKVRGDTEQPYVDMTEINKHIAGIRRDGNWPKGLLRQENLVERIAYYLLDAQDQDPSLWMYGDTYFYMDDPIRRDSIQVVTESNGWAYHERNVWTLVQLPDKKEQLQF